MALFYSSQTSSIFSSIFYRYVSVLIKNTACPMSKRMHYFYLNSFIGRNILLALQQMRQSLRKWRNQQIRKFCVLRYLCKKLGPKLKILSFFPPVIFDRMYLRFQCLSSIFFIKFMVTLLSSLQASLWQKIYYFRLQKPCNSVSFQCI